MTQNRGISLALAAATLFCGCARIHYYRGRMDEEHGDVLRAADQYESYLSRTSDRSRAGEVNARLGSLYASLDRCPESESHYEAALRGPSLSEPWKSLAQAGLMSCPDYFPLTGIGRWIYGDSATLGKNMTLDWDLEPSTASWLARVQSALYAGKVLVTKRTQSYSKTGWTLWENDGTAPIALLRYPFSPGREWTVKLPSGVYVYRIESNNAKVKTAAGIFTGCLKVRETNKKFPGSWEYVYYAPLIGEIKTSIGGPGFENPNTELIRYQTADGAPR